MAVLRKPDACVGCPAFRIGKGFIPPTTVANSSAVLLGSGPTSDEYLDGVAWVGFAGRRLDYWLTRAGLDRSRLTLGHVVQCQLPYEKGAPREPTAAEVDHCRKAHWGGLVDGADLVVPLGVGATKAFLGRKAKARDIGNLAVWGDGQMALPIQSPTYVANGNWAEEPGQIEYLKYAKDIIDGKETLAGRPDFSEPPPGTTVYPPTLPNLAAFRSDIGNTGCTVDIETAGDHIRLVGLYSGDSNSYLGFPIRTVGGGVAWGTDLPRAIEWLYDLLSDPQVGKTFHNGQAFDVPVLERNGFVVGGYEYDTMLGMHVAYPGVPKGLEVLSKVYLRAGGWKGLVREDDEDGEDK